MQAIINALNKGSGLVHWLVRLSLAATFIYHGLPKLMAPGEMAKMMPVVVVLLVGLCEVVGGLLVL